MQYKNYNIFDICLPSYENLYELRNYNKAYIKFK